MSRERAPKPGVTWKRGEQYVDDDPHDWPQEAARRPNASEITDDQLDALYAERDRYREACADVTRSLAVIGGALPESLVRYRNRISLARNRLLAALAPSPAADSTKETDR